MVILWREIWTQALTEGTREESKRITLPRLAALTTVIRTSPFLYQYPCLHLRQWLVLYVLLLAVSGLRGRE